MERAESIEESQLAEIQKDIDDELKILEQGCFFSIRKLF